MYKKTALKLIVVTMISGALLITGCSRRYAGIGHSSEKGTERMIVHLVEELGLNETQKTQLEKTVSSINIEKEVIGGEAFFKEVLAQLEGENIDEKHLNILVSTNSKKVDETLRNFVSHIAEFHGTLTPVQRTKLVMLMKKRKGRGNRHNHRH